MALFAKIPINKSLIEEAIAQLEQTSSAELRVYIENKMPRKAGHCTGFERALQVFDELDMHKTSAHNGVLIYVAFKEHQCSIIGDQGIHQYVGQDFWQQQCDLMIEQFRQKQYTQGIVAAIEQIGKELAQYFPIQADDKNELPNEVIIHD